MIPSRKIRTIFNARTAQSKRVAEAASYGYLHALQDRQQWIVDDEATGHRAGIYRGVIADMDLTQFEEELTPEGVFIPTARWKKEGAGTRISPLLMKKPSILSSACAKPSDAS